VLVVDFVNSIGTIRDAFMSYYGVTTFCSGENSTPRKLCIAPVGLVVG
jgi:hypothetical protein